MKKTLIALALAAVTPVVLAGPKPATKADGGVRFTCNGQQMGLSFNAHAADRHHAAKGTLNLRRFDSTGQVKNTKFRVTSVTISGKVATICGQVTASDMTADLGRWVSIVVVDGGNPGVGHDQIGLTWTQNSPSALANAVRTSRAAVLHTNRNTPGLAPTLNAVTAGNLKVH